MSEQLRILVLEDNAADFALIRRTLQKWPEKEVSLVHFMEPEEAFAHLSEHQVDCVLLDYLLGAETGLDFLKKLRSLGNDTPIVLLTGFGNELVAVEALQIGAQDYLVKGSTSLESLQRAITSAMHQVKLQRELELQQSNLRQFVAVASHDIKSPLNRIHLLAESLHEDCSHKLDEDENEILEQITQNASHLLGFLDALLKHTRDSSATEEHRVVEMNALFAQAQTFLASQVVEASATIDVAALPSVVGEPFGLLQLVQNLLANALKYRVADRPTEISVWYEACKQPELVCFFVRDNGIGIQPRFHQKIFKAMMRLHSQQVYKGYGLGLATCKNIVERHGGTIWVQEVDEGTQGATFVFSLPLAPGATAT